MEDSEVLRSIIAEASKINPAFGSYKEQGLDPFTQGVNVTTSTGYTLGISKELIDSFRNGTRDKKLIERIKIKRSPSTEN